MDATAQCRNREVPTLGWQFLQAVRLTNREALSLSPCLPHFLINRLSQAGLCLSRPHRYRSDFWSPYAHTAFVCLPTGRRGSRPAPVCVCVPSSMIWVNYRQGLWLLAEGGDTCTVCRFVYSQTQGGGGVGLKIPRMLICLCYC